MSLAWAALALAALARAATPETTLAGELTRIDFVRRSVFVKTEGRDARELEAVTSEETRLVARGRSVRLEDLRPGDRVIVAAGSVGGRRVARVVKVVGRAAIPPPPAAAPQ